MGNFLKKTFNPWSMEEFSDDLETNWAFDRFITSAKSSVLYPARRELRIKY